MSRTILRGLGASPGIALGKIARYEVEKIIVGRQTTGDPLAEQDRLARALAQAKVEIQALYEHALQDVGADEAAIFDAHGLLLEDPDLAEQVQSLMQKDQLTAESAWQEGTNYYADQLRALGDEYLSARATDVEDVAQRVLRILAGGQVQHFVLSEPTIIIAKELTPSDTMQLDTKRVLAFCTEQGGPTSHVAILAKALGIPAITGINPQDLGESQNAIIDGSTGLLLLDPSEQERSEYEEKRSQQTNLQEIAFLEARKPALTLDGCQIEVVANIGKPADAEEALRYGAEGVGLLRTEFLFMDRATPPDEEEQYQTYRQILEIMGERPVVVRMLDIGGDKPAPYLLDLAQEMNPFLGLRGVRLTLDRAELMQNQIRALLRAGIGHNLKIMFPMVGVVEEVRAVYDHFRQAREALEAVSISYLQSYEVGIMVELPAAALMADVFAKMVDFVSIGTNDLAQYTLAADRTNAKVSALADALQPSVLRLIRFVIEAAHAEKKWVGLCGELAGEPLAVPALLGFGLDEFSMNARAIPLIKQQIRSYSQEETRAIAAKVLTCESAWAVREYLTSVAR